MYIFLFPNRSNSESSDWQTVRRSSGIIVNSPSNNINGVARNIELDNMFGFLNNSQHDEEHTVQKVPSRYAFFGWSVELYNQINWIISVKMIIALHIYF